MIDFITELLDNKKNPPEDLIERTCHGCYHDRDWGCSLLSGECVNSPYKPYYQKLLQQSPVGYVEL